jgi:hypothetical protein
MKNPTFTRKFACLAVFTTATCWAFGLSCLQEFAASIGATFF